MNPWTESPRRLSNRNESVRPALRRRFALQGQHLPAGVVEDPLRGRATRVPQPDGAVRTHLRPLDLALGVLDRPQLVGVEIEAMEPMPAVVQLREEQRACIRPPVRDGYLPLEPGGDVRHLS